MGRGALTILFKSDDLKTCMPCLFFDSNRLTRSTVSINPRFYLSFIAHISGDMFAYFIFNLDQSSILNMFVEHNLNLLKFICKPHLHTLFV